MEMLFFGENKNLSNYDLNSVFGGSDWIKYLPEEYAHKYADVLWYVQAGKEAPEALRDIKMECLHIIEKGREENGIIPEEVKNLTTEDVEELIDSAEQKIDEATGGNKKLLLYGAGALALLWMLKK